LENGTIERYINDLSITGLTFNPTIFDRAVKNSAGLDASIREGSRNGRVGEELFFDLALEDITRAADFLGQCIIVRLASTIGCGSKFLGPSRTTQETSLPRRNALCSSSKAERFHQDSRNC